MLYEISTPLTKNFSPKNLCAWLSDFRRRAKLSTQISLTYAIILLVTMIITNIVTTAGIYYLFHHFRVITFEKEFIHYLLRVLVVMDVVGLCVALVFGHVLMRRLLSPLRKMTKTAREISVGNFERRLEPEESVSEVVELSESFNAMLDRLEENFNRQQRFISDASHEFRTPLTVIRGYAEMLENYGAQDPELVAEAAVTIKNSAKNMQNLTENLLLLARADEGTQALEKTCVEVNELLKSVVESFKSPRLKFYGGESFEIFGDGEFLKKMFFEFTDNALQYSDGEVVVEVDTSQKDSASVKIIDKGIGISDEDKEKIFDRFFRADKSRTKSDGEKISVGLGLSVAKWIADEHGIKIKIDSELGKGSTFELEFLKGMTK